AIWPEVRILQIIVSLAHQCANHHFTVHEVVHDAGIDHDTAELLAKAIDIMGATKMILGIQGSRDELKRLSHSLRLDLDIEEDGGIVIVVETSNRNGLLLELLPCSDHLIGEIEAEAMLLLYTRLHIAIDIHQVK